MSHPPLTFCAPLASTDCDTNQLTEPLVRSDQDVAKPTDSPRHVFGPELSLTSARLFESARFMLFSNKAISPQKSPKQAGWSMNSAPVASPQWRSGLKHCSHILASWDWNDTWQNTTWPLWHSLFFLLSTTADLFQMKNLLMDTFFFTSTNEQ